MDVPNLVYCIWQNILFDTVDKPMLHFKAKSQSTRTDVEYLDKVVRHDKVSIRSVTVIYSILKLYRAKDKKTQLRSSQLVMLNVDSAADDNAPSYLRYPSSNVKLLTRTYNVSVTHNNSTMALTVSLNICASPT